MILEFKCDCGIIHIIKFDRDGDFVGRSSRL